MYQLVFEIARRTIELSRFRNSYGFLTHFSRWGPILNGCSFSRSSLKYDSQPVPCSGLQELENGSGEGWKPSHTAQERLGYCPCVSQDNTVGFVKATGNDCSRALFTRISELSPGVLWSNFPPVQHLRDTANKCPGFKWTDTTTLQGRQPIFHPGENFPEEIFQQNGFFIFPLKAFPDWAVGRYF